MAKQTKIFICRNTDTGKTFEYSEQALAIANRLKKKGKLNFVVMGEKTNTTKPKLRNEPKKQPEAKVEQKKETVVAPKLESKEPEVKKCKNCGKSIPKFPANVVYCGEECEKQYKDRLNTGGGAGSGAGEGSEEPGEDRKCATCGETFRATTARKNCFKCKPAKAAKTK